MVNLRLVERRLPLFHHHESEVCLHLNHGDVGMDQQGRWDRLIVARLFASGELARKAFCIRLALRACQLDAMPESSYFCSLKRMSHRDL